MASLASLNAVSLVEAGDEKGSGRKQRKNRDAGRCVRCWSGRGGCLSQCVTQCVPVLQRRRSAPARNSTHGACARCLLLTLEFVSISPAARVVVVYLQSDATDEF
jgi:hypothetical protein